MSKASAKAMGIINRMFTAEMQFFHTDGEEYSGVESVFHPDIVVQEPNSLPYAGDWYGYGELIKLWGKMNECWDSIKVEDMQTTIDDNSLFLTCTLIAKARKTGIEIRQPFSEYLELKDDLVVKAIPFYFDTVAIKEALDFDPHKEIK
jgi:ketosteroid isomerase-like protein